MHKTKTLTCDGCGTPFEKSLREVTRQRKKDPSRKFYCTLKCYGAHESKEHLGKWLGEGKPQHLVAGNRLDEFSPFRYFEKKARNRKHETDLDLQFLKELWEKQEGICPLSGTKMDLPPTSLAWTQRKGDPCKPSLDRIDCSKGYLKGNVRFVTVIANFAKQSYSDEVFFTFCRAVADHQTNQSLLA